MQNNGLPQRIHRLEELAYNLWWSWNPKARAIFRSLDYPVWKLSRHNPVQILHTISPHRLYEAASDSEFLGLYDAAISEYDASMSSVKSCFNAEYDSPFNNPIAYFSMEFAIHQSLPIYAGGLGVLAGDICKEASDSGIPMIAVGFMYPQGYFHQHISADGWQQEVYEELDFNETPVIAVPTSHASVQVKLAERLLHIGIWQVNVGRVKMFLLDTNIEANAPHDRNLSNRLYIADREQRLQQEILLGIGGVRALRAMGINPSLWHANEGHTAFMAIERIREEMESGLNFQDSLEIIRSTSIFTTHTPVPAGHDIFSSDLIERYFSEYWHLFGIDRQSFLSLGQFSQISGSDFNMTALALRTSSRCNGVSKLHGEVSRRMWHGLWPDKEESEIPISHITNGVHVLSWMAPEMGRLLVKYLGPGWMQNQDSSAAWENIHNIPDEEMWRVRQILKRKLMHIIITRAQQRWVTDNIPAEQVLAMGALLDREALTIGFARRFTEYKRPSLLFYDLERLKRIITDSWQPVQIVFAGKSHPSDNTSKELMRAVFSQASNREFKGRIAFLEDYDINVAHYLVQGVDVWLNTPRRPREASGTSGIKAAFNGIPHLSILDGWWYEAYNGNNGWAIGRAEPYATTEEEDDRDAEALYTILEQKVIPLYYCRDYRGIPHKWISLVKETMKSIIPVFSARRMMKEYCQKMYIPAHNAFFQQ